MPPRAVTRRGLLAVYAVIPVCLLIAAADAALGGTLRASLPATPDQLFWTNIVLMQPHIMMSLASFLDRDYLDSYRSNFPWAQLAFFAAPLAAAALLGKVFFFLAVSVLGTHHFISQQTGIAKILLGREGPAGAALRWLMTLVLALFWVVLFAHDMHELRHADVIGAFLSGPGSRALWATVCAAVAAMVPLAYWEARGASAAGAAYVWATPAMVAAALGLGFCGYSFLGVLVPRLVHDATAIYVYAVHDANRNRVRVRNVLFRIPWIARLPAAAGTLSIGFGASALVFLVDDKLGLATSLAHYFIEGVIWKRGAPHRAEVPFPAPAR